jgi:hypothetical protein
VKKILKFELYCFLLELSCFLPIHDIFPCFMFVLYISILHKREQIVPFKFVGFFFCTLQRKIICVLPISYCHWTALMRHKFSKWPYGNTHLKLFNKTNIKNINKFMQCRPKIYLCFCCCWQNDKFLHLPIQMYNTV